MTSVTQLQSTALSLSKTHNIISSLLPPEVVFGSHALTIMPSADGKCKQHLFLCYDVASKWVAQWEKNRSSSFSDWNRFSLRFRKCTPLTTSLIELLKELSVIYGQEGKQGLLPFSCSAASLRSGNLDPAKLWLRISLCSCKQTHIRTKHWQHFKEEAFDKSNCSDLNLLSQCFTSLNLDSFCALPCWPGRSLYPEDLKTASLGLSEKVSSGVGGKLGAPFLELRLPTASQETALIRGGKAPIVLISAVQGAC